MNIFVKNKAFTLIELIVSVVLLSTFFGGVYLVYNAGINTYKRSANKAEGLMACYILYQKLVYDLKSAVWTANNRIMVKSENGGLNNVLEFDAFSLEPDELSGSKVETVTYYFDSETNRVYRNRKPVTQSKFEMVEFSIESANDSTGLNASKGNNIHFRITAMGKQGFLEKSAGSLKEEDRKKRTTVLGTVGFPDKTQRSEFPWYVINRTSELRPKS